MVLKSRFIKYLFAALLATPCSSLFSQTDNTHQPDITLINADSLIAYAKSGLKEGKYLQADSLYIRALEMEKEASSEESRKYISILCDYLSLCLENDKLGGLPEKFSHVLNVRKKLFGESSLEYAEPLNHYGRYLMQIADYPNAEKSLMEAYRIRKNAMEQDTKGYIETLLSLSMLYLCTQNYVEAERFCREALQLSEKTNDELNVGLSKANMATYYAHTGKIAESLQLFPEAMQILKKYNGEESPGYVSSLIVYASIYVLCGDHPKAEELTIKSLHLSKKIFGERHLLYFNALSVLSSLYNEQSKFEQAEEMLLKSIEICKLNYGENNYTIIPLYLRLAGMYKSLGNYEKVESVVKKVLDLISLTPDMLKSYKAMSLFTLGDSYFKRKRYDEALVIFRQSLTELQANNNTDSNLAILLAGSICNALMQDKSKDLSAIEKELIEVIASFKEHYSEKSIQYLISRTNLASIYISKGQYDLAMDIYKEGISGFQDKDNTLSWEYVDIVWRYASLLFIKERIKESLLWHETCLDISRKLALRDFLFLSETEREKYWKAQNYRLKDFQSVAVLGCDSEKQYAAFAYDCELFAKNLLLTSSVAKQKAVFRSGNIQLVNLWRQVKSLRDALLNEEANKLERTLVSDLKKAGMPDELSSDWKSVRRMLAPGEAAMEIINCPLLIDGEEPEVCYIALMIRYDSEYPEVITLGDEESIRSIQKLSEEAISPYYNLLWESITPYLSNVSTLYVASSGLFNTISFAAFKNPDGKYITGQYTIHHLLSTRDIASLKAKKESADNKKDIILFGGADYGLSPNALNDKDISRGQGFDFLPGSLAEVQAIEKIASAAKWDVSLFTDNKATEARLKSYSGRSPKVLHISTHGFYYSQPKEESLPDATQLQGNSFSRSAEPMMRSGLLLSGANNIWTGKATADMANDGVLTAYEIANLDLSNTDLVVLSACETGLGDIDYNEGIYGLQRAFRLAGVQAMIISLWKVPDEETSALMTEFYKAWTSGMPMKQAFDKAQLSLQKRYPTDPYKWGGFVLIE